MARENYNAYIGALENLMSRGAGTPTYEDAVQIASRYGGISPQEISGTLYNLYSQYGPAPSQRVTPNYQAPATRQSYSYAPSRSTGRTTSRATSRTTGGRSGGVNANAEFKKYQDYLMGQFQGLYSKYLETLGKKKETAKADFQVKFKQAWDKLQNDFWDNAKRNDKSFGENLKQTTNQYAARNMQDSSYYNNAIGDTRSTFFDNYGGLQRGRTEGENSLNTNKNMYFRDLDSQYNEGVEAANAIKNNFFNPKTPVFTDLSQLASAKQGLDSQMQNMTALKPNIAMGQITAPAFQPTMQDYVNQLTAGNKPVTQQGMLPQGWTQDDLNKYLYPQVGK